MSEEDLDPSAAPGGSSHRPRASAAWDKVASLWQSDAPTNFDMQAITERSDSVEASRLLDLVARMADLALASGSPTAEATAMCLRILAAFDVRAHVYISYESVILSQPASGENPPVTVMRTVRKSVIDYARLAKLVDLADRMADAKLGVTQARAEFNRIAVQPRHYRQWVYQASYAIMGAALAVALGGQVIDMLFAVLATFLIAYAGQKLFTVFMPRLLANAIQASIPTLLSFAGVWLLPAELSPTPSVVVSAGIVSMLVGLNTVTAVRDGLDGYFVTSTARLYESAMSTLGIALGVIGALSLLLALGLPFGINPNVVGPSAWAVTISTSAVMTFFFAVSCHTPLRVAALCAATGVVCQAVSQVMSEIGFTTVIAVGTAAIAVAVLAALLSRFLDIPPIIVIATGIISQVPGLLIYRGMFALVEGQLEPTQLAVGWSLLGQAVLIGLALAIGVSIGTLLGRLILLPQDRITRLAMLRSWRRG